MRQDTTFGDLEALRRRILAFLRIKQLLPATAEDVAQIALMKMWAHRAEYDPTRPIWPWAKMFVIHAMSTHMRSLARRRDSVALGDIVVVAPDRPDARIELLETVGTLYDVCPPHEARNLMLTAFGYLPQERADLLGCKRSTAAVYTGFARKRLREACA